MTHTPDEPLLNVSEVLRLIAERDLDHEEVLRAQAKAEESERRLSAVELLIGRRRLDEIRRAAKRDAPKAPPIGSTPSYQAKAQGVEVAWTDWIVEQVTALGGRATTRQLADAARADPRMRDRFHRTPNGYYNGLSRVVARNRANKHGNVIYLPHVGPGEIEEEGTPPRGGPLFN